LAIRPNPNQPRRRFDAEALAALTASVREHGVLQPLLVRPAGDGYEVIAGERRLRAAVAAGLAEVPIVVRDADPRQRMELALIENLQREDLSPLEEAAAYRQLMDEFRLTQDEIAGRVGKSRPAIANSLRLLSLPDAVKAQVEAGELSAGHARAVLSVDPAAQVDFARELVEGKVPKSEAERLAASRRPKGRGRRAGRSARASATLDPNWRAAADGLTRALGTRVRLERRGRGGTIEIEFYSEPELDRLITVLTRSTSR
jgi:ParB family chromosome partitioning protein